MKMVGIGTLAAVVLLAGACGSDNGKNNSNQDNDIWTQRQNDRQLAVQQILSDGDQVLSNGTFPNVSGGLIGNQTACNFTRGVNRKTNSMLTRIGTLNTYNNTNYTNNPNVLNSPNLINKVNSVSNYLLTQYQRAKTYLSVTSGQSSDNLEYVLDGLADSVIFVRDNFTGFVQNGNAEVEAEILDVLVPGLQWVEGCICSSVISNGTTTTTSAGCDTLPDYL